MATIPEFKRQVGAPRAIDIPKQSAQAPAGAFGETNARILAAAGGVVTDLSEGMAKQQALLTERRDTATANDAYVSMAEWAAKYRNEVFSDRYGDAEGSAKRAKDDYNTQIQTLSKGMSPGAAERFKAKSQNLYISEQRVIVQHEANQLREHEARTTSEVLRTETDRVTNEAVSKEPEAIDRQINNFVVPAVQDASALSDIPQDELLATTKAAMYSDIINQSIARGNTERAKGLLDRWGDDLTEDEETRLITNIRKTEINNTAEDTAFDMYTDLQAGKTTPTEINNDINQIEDPDLKRATRAKARSYVQQFNAEQAAWVQQETIDQVGQLDERAGNLVSQQNLVDNYLVENESQRKVKTQMNARLVRYKSAEGLRPMTDPGAYADAEDAIISAEVTTPEEIDERFGVSVEKPDRDDLKKDLEDTQKTQKETLKIAYAQAKGIEGGSEIRYKGSRQKDYGEFMLWANSMAKESNRAQEPDYLQELADMWALKGERARRLTPGYGVDVTFGDAVRAGTVDKFLPDTPDDKSVSELRTLLDSDPAEKQKWLNAYGGDEELVIRKLYQLNLLEQLGPKK
jgi:hypothetical protein